MKIFLVHRDSSAKASLYDAYRLAGFDEAQSIEDADLVVVDGISYSGENLFILPEVKEAIKKDKEVISVSNGVPFKWTAGDFTFDTKLHLIYEGSNRVVAYIDSPIDQFKFLPSVARIILDGNPPDALDYTENHYIPSSNERCCYVKWRNLYF